MPTGTCPSLSELCHSSPTKLRLMLHQAPAARNRQLTTIPHKQWRCPFPNQPQLESHPTLRSDHAHSHTQPAKIHMVVWGSRRQVHMYIRLSLTPRDLLRNQFNLPIAVADDGPRQVMNRSTRRMLFRKDKGRDLSRAEGRVVEGGSVGQVARNPNPRWNDCGLQHTMRNGCKEM